VKKYRDRPQKTIYVAQKRTGGHLQHDTVRWSNRLFTAGDCRSYIM